MVARNARSGLSRGNELSKVIHFVKVYISKTWRKNTVAHLKKKMSVFAKKRKLIRTIAI